MVRLAGTRDILKATNVTMKVLHTVYCCFQTNQVEVAQTLCLAPEQLTNEQRHLHFQVPIIKKHHINGDVPSKTKALPCHCGIRDNNSTDCCYYVNAKDDSKNIFSL